MIRSVVITVVLSSLPASSALAGACERMGRELARAAVTQGKSRTAVLPFQGMDGAVSLAGRVAADRLTACVAGSGRVQVVERTLLRSLMDELRLGYLGIVDARSAQELGRVLGVESVVVGSVLPLRNGQLEVNARLIDSATGRVLGASAARMEVDWAEPRSVGRPPWSAGDEPALPLLWVYWPRMFSFSPWAVAAEPAFGFEQEAAGEPSAEQRPQDRSNVQGDPGRAGPPGEGRKPTLRRR